MSKVVSVRMSAQTLADVYNFLSIACEIQVTNLPVSRAVNMSLDNMMRWVRHSISLPEYATDKEALDVVEGYINRVPGTFNNPVPVQEMKHGVIEESTINHLINHNLPDKTIQESPPLTPESSVELTPEDIEKERDIKASKKENMIGLIDQFRDGIEERERNDLLDKITTGSVYKDKGEDDAPS